MIFADTAQKCKLLAALLSNNTVGSDTQHAAYWITPIPLSSMLHSEPLVRPFFTCLLCLSVFLSLTVCLSECPCFLTVVIMMGPFEHSPGLIVQCCAEDFGVTVIPSKRHR